MTLTPLLTLSHPRQVKDNFIILQKIEYSDVFRCRLDYRQRTEFLKTDSESLFLDGSGHFFNFCLAPSWAEKTRQENGGTDPRGFAAAETGFWRNKKEHFFLLQAKVERKKTNPSV